MPLTRSARRAQKTFVRIEREQSVRRMWRCLPRASGAARSGTENPGAAFVNEKPVIREVRIGRLATERNGDERSIPTKTKRRAARGGPTAE